MLKAGFCRLMQKLNLIYPHKKDGRRVCSPKRSVNSNSFFFRSGNPFSATSDILTDRLSGNLSPSDRKPAIRITLLISEQR
jgi:hypothetical protein